MQKLRLNKFEKTCRALPARDCAKRRLVRRNNESGRGDQRRRSLIAECADTGQATVGRAGQSGSAQHEGEGEEETEGSHLTVSGVGRRWRRFDWPIRNDAPFPEFCIEAENGFLQQEIVSSTRLTKQPWEYINDFSSPVVHWASSIVHWPREVLSEAWRSGPAIP
jgi:hypothetical protein